MKRKYELDINPEFKNLSGFIHSLPMQYDNLGEVIYSDRNEIKVICISGIPLAIKYYKHLSLINRLTFSILGVSKAKNAYKHSSLLLSGGVNTPIPVGYIDCYQNGIIGKSFFVSLYSDYEPLAIIIERPINESLASLKAFAQFTYIMHKKGFFPGDYNVSNVRHKLTAKGYDFELIDINRMNINNFTFKKGTRNLRRLSIPADKLGIVAAEYARQVEVDDFKALGSILFYRWNFLTKKKIKKFLKKWLGINKRKNKTGKVFCK